MTIAGTTLGKSGSGAVPRPVGAPTLPDVHAPDGSEIRFLLGIDQGTTRSSVVQVTLAAGQISRPVRHRTVEECWYVLSGTGDVWRAPETDGSGGEIDRVRTGDALAIPVGWAFQFKADDEASLTFLCVTMPPWPGADEAVAVDQGGLGRPTV